MVKISGKFVFVVAQCFESKLVERLVLHTKSNRMILHSETSSYTVKSFLKTAIRTSELLKIHTLKIRTNSQKNFEGVVFRCSGEDVNVYTRV